MKSTTKRYALHASTLALITIAFSGTLSALPRFALTSGQTCSSCHVLNAGGGMRNEGGFTTMKRTGLWSLWEAPESNTILSENISWGFDLRNQIAYRYEDGKYRRRPFFMQIMPYVSYKPIEAVELHAGVNLVEPVWPSQGRVTAALIARPRDWLSIEAGYFQPDIGLRHDDHTTLTRSALRFYPGWNEAGAALTLTPLDWLSVSGGAFDAGNRMKESFVPPGTTPIENRDLIFTGKLHLQYADYDAGYSGFAGASFFTVGGQRITGIHAGVGLLEKMALYGEYLSMTNSTDGAAFDPTVNVYSVGASYDIVEAFALTARYEEARYENTAGAVDLTRQYVLGAQIFVLPSVELRPEYRWRDTPTVRIAQWGGQVHLFF